MLRVDARYYQRPKRLGRPEFSPRMAVEPFKSSKHNTSVDDDDGSIYVGGERKIERDVWK